MILFVLSLCPGMILRSHRDQDSGLGDATVPEEHGQAKTGNPAVFTGE